MNTCYNINLGEKQKTINMIIHQLKKKERIDELVLTLLSTNGLRQNSIYIKLMTTFVKLNPNREYQIFSNPEETKHEKKNNP